MILPEVVSYSQGVGLRKRFAMFLLFNSEETVSCRLAVILNSQCGVPIGKRKFSSYGSLLRYDPYRDFFWFFAFLCATFDLLHSSCLSVAFLHPGGGGGGGEGLPDERGGDARLVGNFELNP